MRLERVTFPEALARLASGLIAPNIGGSSPAPPPLPEPEGPSGLPEANALALIVGAEAWLWSPSGPKAWLT